MHPRLRDVRRFGVQVEEDCPTRDEVRWWMRNHASFPFDFLKVRKLYEEAKRKGEVKDESDKRVCDTGASR